jgi:ureidoacrylate peracid hydrolase
MVDIAVGRSLLLVHDVVNHFVDRGGPDLAPVLANIARLLAAARRHDLPVAFAVPGRGEPAIGPRPGSAQSIWGSAAAEVPDALQPSARDLMVRKPRYGAFFGTDLEARMRGMGRDTLVICGISLAGGVETTVRDADNRDLASVVVEDACLCRGIPDLGWGAVSAEDVARVTLSLIAERFADVASTDEICAALARA